MNQELNPAQHLAVHSPYHDQLIVACPGSGKTHTLAAKIRHWIDSGTNPASIVAITYTVAAAQEIKRRVGVPLGHVGTVHSYALKVLKADGHLIGVPDSISVMDEEAEIKLLEEVIEEQRFKGSFAEASESVASDPLLDKPERNMSKVELVNFAYHRKMLGSGVLSYDALLIIATRCVRSDSYDKRVSLMVDEYQDASALVHEFCKSILATRRTFVGDPDQCQPAGTSVKTSSGFKRIADIAVGDKLESFDRKAGRITGGHAVTKVASRYFSGELIQVQAGDSYTSCTPNHRWLVRWTDRATKACVTYLMYRKDRGWRVGWCQLFKHHKEKSHDLHFSTRCRLEGAEKGYILSIHESRTGASVEESIISTRFGIPTVTFNPVNGVTHMTEDSLKKIFDAAAPRAVDCLKAFGRELDFPFYRKGGQRGRTTFMEVEACNLFAEHHSVYRNDGSWKAIQLAKIPYSGLVYSLDVEKTHAYIADGLCTLNSIYGFTGGNPKHMLSLSEVFLVDKLQENYRCKRTICRVANDLIKHNAGRIESENVAVSPEFGEVEFRLSQNTQQEAEWLAQRVRKLSGSTAVLCRTNFVAESVAGFLRGYGIEVQRKTREKLPKDFALCLKFIALVSNPASDFLAADFVRATKGDDAAKRIRRDAAVGMTTVSELLKVPAVTLETLLPTLGMIGIGPETMELVRKTAETLEPGDGLAELGATLLGCRKRGEAARQAEAGIEVMTVHAAKGREWDNVFVVGCEEGLFPKGDDLAEERRLFYVAVTRARSFVGLSYAAERKRHMYDRGGETFPPSRFVKECGVLKTPEKEAK